MIKKYETEVRVCNNCKKEKVVIPSEFHRFRWVESFNGWFHVYMDRLTNDERDTGKRDFDFCSIKCLLAFVTALDGSLDACEQTVNIRSFYVA